MMWLCAGCCNSSLMFADSLHYTFSFLGHEVLDGSSRCRPQTACFNIFPSSILRPTLASGHYDWWSFAALFWNMAFLKFCIISKYILLSWPSFVSKHILLPIRTPYHIQEREPCPMGCWSTGPYLSPLNSCSLLFPRVIHTSAPAPEEKQRYLAETHPNKRSEHCSEKTAWTATISISWFSCPVLFSSVHLGFCTSTSSLFVGDTEAFG